MRAIPRLMLLAACHPTPADTQDPNVAKSVLYGL